MNSQSPPPWPGLPDRPRFEYLQHDTHWPRLAGETLDMPAEWHTLEFGQNGWELVTVVRTPTGTLTALFKRQVVGGQGLGVSETSPALIPNPQPPTPKTKRKS